MSVQRENIHTVLGVNSDNDVVVVETYFEYNTDVKVRDSEGFTGAILQPVSEFEIAEAMSPSAMEDWYEELWRADAGTANGTTLSLSDWVMNIPEDEYLESRFEPYYSIDSDEIAAIVGHSEVKRYTPISFGRIFPKALEGLVINDTAEVRELIERIRKVESA